MKYKLRRYILYYLARSAAFFARLVPLCVLRPAGGLLGRVVYQVLPRYRRLTLENLKAAFSGEKSDPEIKKIAAKVFENLGKNAAELLNFPKINRGNLEKLVKIKGLEKLDGALAHGNGVILITAHFGNWELLAISMRLKGYKGAAIARRIYFEKYDNFLNRLRGIHDVDVIYRDDSPKKVLRVLKGNGIMGILADQDVDSVDGVFVDFFGMPAYTPSGPVLLAVSSGAKIVPAFIIRRNGSHELVIEDPIELDDTGEKEKDVVTNTQRWSAVVESYIKRYPEQWVWMHRRWKTKKA